jgi:CRISPR/Cas system CMR-associated protein Cmr3 (group 5 of RAMP superfamily)
MFRPFSFLDDVQKVIYSEKYEKYLALKLADLRKTEGNRDHLIVELTDRELFADFVMEYAEKEEDEVIFEQNEEFSMIADSSPVWFSFEDVERCNKTRDSKNQFKNQDLTGFLEHKASLGINIGAIFKMMVSQKANWVQKYFAL